MSVNVRELDSTSAPARELTSRWENASATSNDNAAVGQKAGWAQVAAAYDRARGLTPVLVSAAQDGKEPFYLPLSIGRERGAVVARATGETFVPYSGVVGSTPDAPALRAALMELRKTHRLSFALFARVLEGSPLWSALDHLGALTLRRTTSAIMNLTPEGPVHRENGKTAVGYRQASRRRRALARSHKHAFKVYTGGDSGLREILDQALIWKRDWLDEKSLAGRLRHETSYAETWVDLLARTGTNSLLGVLTVDGEPAAVEGGFVADNRFHVSFKAYKPSLGKIAVGNVCAAEFIDHVARNDIGEFDFGAPVAPYKLDWSNWAPPVADRLLPLSAVGYAYGYAVEAGLRPLKKKLFGYLPAGARQFLLEKLRNGG